MDAARQRQRSRCRRRRRRRILRRRAGIPSRSHPAAVPCTVHPLHRYAAQQPQRRQQQDLSTSLSNNDADEPQQDPSRYDDALYGRIESGEQDYQRDPAYPDDPYAYQSDEYEEEPAPQKRSQRADDGCRRAGAGRGGDRGCLRLSHLCRLAPQRRAADHQGRQQPDQGGAGASPMAGAAKTPDRMPSGDGGEKLVSREETPVDVNSRSGGPRVVFPPLNQNSNPPPAASVSPHRRRCAGAAANGTMPNNEPRKIKTLAVKGDAAENGGIPAGAAAPAKPDRPPPDRQSAPPAAGPARNPCGRQCQRQCADVAVAAERASIRSGAADPRRRDQCRPDGSGAAPRRRQLSGSGLLAEERGRRAGLLPRAAKQVPGRAGFRARR